MAPNASRNATVPAVVDVFEMDGNGSQSPSTIKSKKSAGNSAGSLVGDPQPRRLRCMEPDLTIVVGSGKRAQEFHHISALLCASCEYFDSYIARHMNKDERVISFPKFDPEGWKLLFPHLEHNTIDSMKINKNQAARLLVWFDVLRMADMADKCDVLFTKRVMESLENPDEDASVTSGGGNANNSYCLDENLFMEWWKICEKLPCPKTKQGLRQLLLDMDIRRQVKGRGPKHGPRVIIKLMPIIKTDEEIRRSFFSQIYVPQAVKEMRMDDLLENPLLEHFLTARVILGSREAVGCVKLWDEKKGDDGSYFDASKEEEDLTVN